jgi:uncharacterized protein
MPPDSADENLAIVRRFMNSAGEDKRAERADLLRDDCVVKTASGLSFSGEYHGKRGFFDLRAKMDEIAELAPTLITMSSLGEHAVAVHLRLMFTARSSDQSVETDVVELYTIKDGQIVELDVYYKDPLAVATLLAK